MGGGRGHGESTTYTGFTMHHSKRWHVVTGKGLCAIMWFGVLYRAKQDGPVVLGWRYPWEGHEDHSHGHGEHEWSHWAAGRRKFYWSRSICDRKGP